MTVRVVSAELTRINLPDFGPWAAESWLGWASTRVALNICGGMLRTPLCCG
ncbi:hypothetical protein D3C81_2104180 [compost metagenome]